MNRFEEKALFNKQAKGRFAQDWFIKSSLMNDEICPQIAHIFDLLHFYASNLFCARSQRVPFCLLEAWLRFLIPKIALSYYFCISFPMIIYKITPEHLPRQWSTDIKTLSLSYLFPICYTISVIFGVITLYLLC